MATKDELIAKAKDMGIELSGEETGAELVEAIKLKKITDGDASAVKKPDDEIAKEAVGAVTTPPANAPEQNVAPVLPPTVASTSAPSPAPVAPDTITLSRAELEALMKRTVEAGIAQFKESLDDPKPILRQKVKVHTAKVSMYKGKYVVAFKNHQTNPGAGPLYFVDEFNPNRKRIEEYVTLIYKDGSDEKVCYVDFLNAKSVYACKIKKIDKEPKVHQYSAITDPSFSGGEPEEVLMETKWDLNTYTIVMPEGDEVIFTQDSNGWVPLNM